MTRPTMIRSITLAQSLVDTWKEVGGWFPRRDRTAESVLSLMADSYERDAPIINLGNSQFNPDDELLDTYGMSPLQVWNKGHDTVNLIRPSTARRVWGDLMPAQPDEYPVEAWVKSPGYGGRGKERIWLQTSLDVPGGWDVQLHVEGQEYRAITVGDKVVQGYERHGVNGDRSYTWTGVQGLPLAVRALALKATSRLHGQNFIAWDTMLNDDAVYLFEGNTCPGVNLATAQRVVAQMIGEHYARRS